MTAGALAILSMLLAAQPAGGGARADAVRRELSEVATRIEQMKAAGVRGGTEIEALLTRSQGLAAELERLERRTVRAEPAAEGGDPQELRERADALRDEVDQLQSALADVDRRLREEGRRRRAGRIARMEEEGALFSDATPGRVGTPRTTGGATGTSVPGPTAPEGPSGVDAPGSAGPGGSGVPEPSAPDTPPSPPPGSGDFQPATGTPTVPESVAPPAEDPAPGSATETHVWSSPSESRSWADRLTPGRSDGEPELRRKRAAIVEAIDDAQARILRIEAEARELDSRP